MIGSTVANLKCLIMYHFESKIGKIIDFSNFKIARIVSIAGNPHARYYIVNVGLK